jgi:hypothetical protein
MTAPTESPAFESFMDRLTARPLPQNPMARVRTFAKELAEGAAANLWGTEIYAFRGAVNETAEPHVAAYLTRRWVDGTPGWHLLLSNGYVTWNNSNAYTIQKAAFDLLEEVEPASIFISYRRSESSAFALAVLSRLKAAGLEPFLDLALEAGEDWERGLKERIQRYQYLIALLGPTTLQSEVVRQELTWALESKLAIIPVWHSGFVFRAEDWPQITLALHNALSKTHTIRVMEESALGYNNAIVELLNRFGVTP